MRRLLFLYLFCFVYSQLYSVEPSRGLVFASHETKQENRTSLHLTSESKIKFTEYFSLEFDFKLKRNRQCFGYIFRIILNESTNIDLLIHKPDNQNLSYFLSSGDLIYNKAGEVTKDITNEFKHVKIELCKKENKLKLRIDTVYTELDYPLDKSNKADIFFGVSQHIKYTSYDTPPFILKDVVISLTPSKPKYHWSLGKHTKDDIVFDELNHKEAKVSNPEWLIDSHASWKLRKSLTNFSTIYPVFDGNQTIYLITEKSAIAFNIPKNTSLTYNYPDSIDPTKFVQNFCWDPYSAKLFCYNFQKTSSYISYFNFEKSSWDREIINEERPTQWMQHSKIILPADSTFLRIFGYGYHKYNASMDLYSFANKNLKKIDLSTKIEPRYLSSLGFQDSILYIYGGVGNKSGEQTHGSYIFNDLFRIDLRDFSISKVWSEETSNKSIIAAGNIIINDSLNALGLMYNPVKYSNSLQLGKINLAKYELKLLADTLPYYFKDTDSQANLYFSKDHSELYAATVYKNENNKYEFNLYSISYPVINREDAIQKESKKWFSYVIVAVIIILLASLLFFWRILKRRQNSDCLSSEIATSIIDGEECKLSTGIYLLGGFNAIDKEGNDITKEFTPIMKRILALIILESKHSENGISNSRLKELFWSDKPEKSARNNRSVNIRKIRLLIEKIGKLDLVYNSNWRIEYEEDIYCDYVEVIDLLKTMTPFKEESFLEISKKISRGSLLPDMQDDYFDIYKADYTDLILDTFTKIYDNKEVSTNLQLTILLADAILMLDMLNEFAIRIKCQALIKSGRSGSARSVFDRFINEYELMIGKEFPKEFNQFMS